MPRADLPFGPIDPNLEADTPVTNLSPVTNEEPVAEPATHEAEPPVYGGRTPAQLDTTPLT